MIAIGRHAGREVTCLLTDMDQPLGAAVGNALEVREARDTVRGHGPADFTELVLDACARLLAYSDLGIDEVEGRRRAEAAVADGSADATWRRWIEAQGGTADESALPVAPVVRPVDGARRRLRGRAERDRRRERRGAPRRGPAHEGGRDRPRRRRRRAREARRTGRSRASRWPTCTRGPRRRRVAAAEVLAAYELGAVRTRRAARAARRRSARAMPELPEVETVRARLAPRARGTPARARRDRRPAADPSVTTASRSRASSTGERVDDGRSPRQVPDRSVRVGTCAPDPPPDDGVGADRRSRHGRGRPAPARRCHA